MKSLDEVKEEISKIREHIYSSFNNIEFFEEKHEYFVNERKTNERVKYNSVSSIIGRYEQPFNAEEVAERYAIKNGREKEDVLSEWRYTNLCSTISGTRVHLYGEGYTWKECGLFDKIPIEVKPQFVLPEKWLIPTSPKEVGVKKFYDNLHPTLFPIGAEFIMSSENLDIKSKICGTTDLLFYFNHPTDESKSGVILADWKGLALDTPLATIDGWKTMGEIEEGDIVFDKNGKPTKVKHVSEVHHNPCLKIVFDNKSEIVCDEDHRWEIYFEKSDKKGSEINELYDTKIMTAKELYEFTHKIENEHITPLIINVKPLDLKEKDLPQRAYDLGSKIVFSEKLDENECNQLIRSSYEQRMDALISAMDEVGYYSISDSSYNLPLGDNEKVEFFLKLISTLGIKPYIKEVLSSTDKNTTNTLGIKFYQNFYTNKILGMEVERDIINNRDSFRSIVNIEYVDTIPTKCIEVDSETHTYCFGYEMIVTHNTNKDLTKEYKRNNHIVMKPPFNDLIDEPLSHYTLQFGCYQMMLESIGIKIIGRRLIWLKENDYELFKIQDITPILRGIL